MMTTPVAEATKHISLNSDIGEGYGAYSIADDAALMALVSDVNVACGFHGGDPSIMRRTCEVAARDGLGVGAHFGFFDLRGFGRREIDQPPTELRDDIDLPDRRAARRGRGCRNLRLLRPSARCALPHSRIKRPDYTEAMLDAIEQAAPGLPMLCLPGVSLVDRAIERGITVLREGFIDRTFLDDGRLTPRSRPEDALVKDPQVAASRAVDMVVDGQVESVSGNRIPMEIDTLCIHSDSPGAVELATHVRAVLQDAGVVIKSMF